MCKHPPIGFHLTAEDMAALDQDDLDEGVYQMLVRLNPLHAGWVALFLAAGANPNAPRAMSPTRMQPLHVLAGRSTRGNAAAQQEVAQALLAAGATLDGLDTEGATPLHLALDDHDTPYAHWLLDQGADPLRRDVAGTTPLHRWGRPGALFRVGPIPVRSRRRDGPSHPPSARRRRVPG